MRGIKLREKLKWRKMQLVLVGLGGAGGAAGVILASGVGAAGVILASGVGGGTAPG